MGPLQSLCWLCWLISGKWVHHLSLIFMDVVKLVLVYVKMVMTMMILMMMKIIVVMVVVQ